MMTLVAQPNRWSCGLASLAMVLNEPIGKLVQEIGHDGSAIILPDLPEPFCRRSFVIEEFQDVCFKRGLILAPFDFPIIEEGIPVYSPERAEERLFAALKGRRGLIEGMYALDRPHIVAWDGFRVADPTNLSVYSFDDVEVDKITVTCFWMLGSLL